MSAWGIGRQDPAETLGSDPLTIKGYVDRTVRWIPADVVAIYTLGITALKAQATDPNPSWLWLIIAAVLAPGLVLWGSRQSRRRLTRRDWARAALALVAFGIWSLAIPDSGWYEWSLVKSNPGWVALMAAVLGLVFGEVATELAGA